MILGRPTNLWLGVITAILGLVQVVVPQINPDIDGTTLTVVLGAVGLVLGSLIALIANQPPVVNPGDTITVTTPQGQPNEVRTVQ